MLESRFQLLNNICTSFESQTCTADKDTGVHNTLAFVKDMQKIVTILIEKDVFEPKLARGHPTFTFKEGILQRHTASNEQVLKKVEVLVKGLVAN